MASIKPSRKAVPSLSTDSSKTVAPGSQDRKSIVNLGGSTGLIDKDGSIEEEILHPIPTGDLRLALTRKSPSLKYLNGIRMDRLMSKMMLMNFASALPTGISSSGLSRDYFFDEKPDRAVERFQVFANLAVWMIRQLGVDLKQPTERDDPNLTVQFISESLRTLGVQFETVPHRLKNANGSDVVTILYELACMCLKNKSEFSAPNFQSTIAMQGHGVEEEAENVEEDEEYEAIPLFDWEQEEVAEDLNDNDIALDNRQATTEALVKQKQADEWRLEADRMAPLFNRPDDGLSDRVGWSDRVKKLEAYRKELDQSIESVSEKFSGISMEISRSTERIHNREKYINVNHRDKVERFRVASAKFHLAKSRYEAHNSEVDANARKLAELTAEFEKLRRRVEDKGNNIGDKATITGMKSAMKRMKEEMGVYNIKCAIAEMRLQELTEMIQNAEVEEKFNELDSVGILPGTV